MIESPAPGHIPVVRTNRLLLACVASGLLAGCGEPSKTEIWDLRADPSLCDNGVDYQFCTRYSVVGGDESGTLYKSIDGLDHEYGHSYRVEVEIIETEPEGTDDLAIRYELIEIIEEETHPELEFDLSLPLGSVEFDPEGDGGRIATAHAFTCEPEQCTELQGLFDEFIEVNATFRFGAGDQLFPLELVSSSVDDG